MDQPVLVEGERYWGHHPHLPIVVGRVYARDDDREPAADDFTGVCHTHDHPELVVVYGGTAQHNLEGQDYPISAGDVFCILGNQAHYYHAMDRLKLLNVMYDPLGAGLPLGLLEKVPGYNALFKLEPNYRQQHQFSSRLTLEPAELAQVVNLAESMYAEIDRQPDGYEASTFAGLIRLILYLSRHYGEHSSKEAGALLRVSNVLVALEQDPRRPLDTRGHGGAGQRLSG